MSAQFVKTPIFQVSGQILETREQAISLLERLKPDQHLSIEQCCKVIGQLSKNIGGACRHSVHTLEAPGQGGNQ